MSERDVQYRDNLQTIKKKIKNKYKHFSVRFALNNIKGILFIRKDYLKKFIEENMDDDRYAMRILNIIR